MKWNDRTTFAFVEQYLKHECLYNTKCNTYRNKLARDAAINELCEFMNLSAFGPKEAVAKIKCIRSTYSQEIKKINESEDVYVPKLKWFSMYHDVMCAKNLTPRERQSTEYCGQSNWNTVEFTVDGIESDEEFSGEEAPDSSRLSLLEPSPDTQEADAVTKPAYSQKRKNKCFESSEKKVKVVGEMAQTPTTNAQNEFDIFGKSIAAQLNAMPLMLALQAQSHIQSYLTSFRVQAMNAPNTKNAKSFRPSHPSHTTYVSTPKPVRINSVAVVPTPIIIKKDQTSGMDSDSD